MTCIMRAYSSIGTGFVCVFYSVSYQRSNETDWVRFVAHVNSLNGDDKTRRIHPREGLAVRPDLMHHALCLICHAITSSRKTAIASGRIRICQLVPCVAGSDARVLGVSALMTGTCGSKLITRRWVG